jgi:uncharacterized protein (TIGR02687 family)
MTAHGGTRLDTPTPLPASPLLPGIDPDSADIADRLRGMFDTRGHVIFWEDPEREFVGGVDWIASALAPSGIVTLRLDRMAALRAKLALETAAPGTPHLIYAPAEPPPAESDWLLDVRHYARTFRADRASMMLRTLGLNAQSLRDHLAKRQGFLASPDRVERLKAVVDPDDDGAALDRRMLALLARAEQPDPLIITRALLHAMADAPERDLDTPPPAWVEIERFNLAPAFWDMAKASFGYAGDDPSLGRLAIRLLVADFTQALHPKATVPPGLSHLMLPVGASTSNAAVCLAQWRDSRERQPAYGRMAAMVAEKLDISGHLDGLDLEHLLDVMTFAEVERVVAARLRDRIEETVSSVDVPWVRSVVARRCMGHWAGEADAPHGGGLPSHPAGAVLAALEMAACLFDLRNRYPDDFCLGTPEAFVDAYTTELYQGDQWHRKFCTCADRAEAEGWDILKSLREKVEGCYGAWFLPRIALEWGAFFPPAIPAGSSLLDTWRIGNAKPQTGFFDRHIRVPMGRREVQRVFVVISDALRYEAGEELTRRLTSPRYKDRFRVSLDVMLGVLPSYTALGMAALLPHRQLGFRPDGEVTVDGGTAAGLAERSEILKAEGGVAVRAEDLRAMKKPAGRSFAGAYKVIYVYHDRIDATGDKQASEAGTFDAVDKALDELASLVAHIVNNLNGGHVLVTSDHGFLYQDSAPGLAERSGLEEKPAGTVIAKKRYLLGHGLPESDQAWRGSTGVTASAEGGIEFWVPRGVNRFHFAGGARFIHGGAMPQEVLVPLITVRELEGNTLTRVRGRSVGVQILGSVHKVTTSRHRFQLIQMDAVGQGVRPVTVQAALYDGTEPVSTIETVTFDSSATALEERVRWITLSLSTRDYDRKRRYALVLRESGGGIDGGAEVLRVDVTIDLAFGNDF